MKLIGMTIDILNKIASLQCSWIRRFYDILFHEWKLIPLFLIIKSFGSSFKFHSNYFSREIQSIFFHLSIEKSFYTGKNILPESLKYHLAFISVSMVQYLWYNKNIQEDKNSIRLVRFFDKNINYVSQLFRPDGLIKTWYELKTEHKLHKNSYFQWLQPISAIPEGRKFMVKENHESKTNLIIHDHHVIKDSTVLTLDKLTSTGIYAISISKVQNKRSANFYFKNLFDGNDIDWATIYVLPRLGKYNTYKQSFQYKILNNVLFLSKNLHIFGIKSSTLCSFCNLCNDTPLHIFYECNRFKCLWSKLSKYLVLPTLTPQTAIFRFLDFTNSDSKFKKSKLLINHILLIFKLYIYRSSEK